MVAPVIVVIDEAIDVRVEIARQRTPVPIVLAVPARKIRSHPLRFYTIDPYIPAIVFSLGHSAPYANRRRPMLTHICLVLDRSGSMQAIRAAALGGVNGYIMAAKQDRALYESKFSLITFSSESVDTIRENEIMEQVKPISGDEFRCAGWTPLYDAIGRGIGILDEATGATSEYKCILVVMTDGQENASREFSHDKITALIQARRERGWLVTF